MGIQNIKLTFTIVLFSLLFINAAVAEDILFVGESVNTGQLLEIDVYQLRMQADCNLVLYKTDVTPNRALWATGTNGRGTTCRATLLNTGVLAIILNNVTIWTSGTPRGAMNGYRLIVQGDGNVVIYGAALWATNTVQRTARTLTRF